MNQEIELKLEYEFLDSIKDNFLEKLSNLEVTKSMQDIEECYLVEYWSFLKQKGYNERLPLFNLIDEYDFANYISNRFENIKIEEVSYLKFYKTN